jgi:hypothetical protein
MKTICKKASQTESSVEFQTLDQDQEIIVCAFCNHYITEPSDQIQVNQSFRHIFANPHGYIFEIGCFSNASGCKSTSISSHDFSWFVGYSWEIGVCRQCSNHLGWFFSSNTDSFYGLILEKLIFL